MIMTDATPDRVKAVIEDGQVVIRINQPALNFAVEKSFGFEACNEHGTPLRISDNEALMQSFVDRLNEEEEDGCTLVIQMVNQAIEQVLENGDDGVEEIQ